MIQPGQPAPDFSLRDQNRAKQTLSKYRGQPVVLLFYPKDFSSTCSEEMACMVDQMPRFRNLDAQVFGISIDHTDSHRVFAAQTGIDFPLLADFHPKGEVAQMYDIYLPDYGISSRGYVVIDPQGQVTAAKDVGPGDLPDFDEIAAEVAKVRAE